MAVVSEARSPKKPRVEFQTTMGTFVVTLFNETPLHRDNFLKLVREGYYDGLLFHRVIRNFMVQAGDPDSRQAPAGKLLGEGGPGYTLPAEIDPFLYHWRGALAALASRIMSIRSGAAAVRSSTSCGEKCSSPTSWRP